MSSYSCISCRVSFLDSELQRHHYKSDWHRYNLKRKVADLPPITQEVFTEKLTQQRNQAEDQKKDTSKFCNVCSKSFSNENAYANHINSKKHKMIEGKAKGNKLVENSIIEGNHGPHEQGSKEELLSKKDESKKIISKKAKNANIPDEEIRIDDNGSEDDDDDDEWEDVEDEDSEEEGSEDEETEAIPPSTCLFCPHQSVSLEDSLHHMTKSHSFFIPDIDYITELEDFIIYLGAKVGDGKICLFCNKKSHTFLTIDAVQKHMRDKGHCMVDYEGDSALEYSDFYDFSSSYQDFDPENDDEDSEVEAGALEVDADTMELILPSGSRVGHRSLKHIYNQSMPPAHLQRKQERATIKGLNAAYRSLGWHGSVSQSTRETMSSVRMKRQQGQKRHLKLGMKANKFQPHLRPQVIF